VSKTSLDLDKKSLPFIIPTILVLGIGLGLALAQIFGAVKTSSNIIQSTASIESSQYVTEVYNLIKDKFIGDTPQGRNLDYAKIKGIVESLDSKYTSFLTPEEAAEYKKAEDPNFEGIGVSLKFNGEGTEIETVMSNYPAEKAGLKAKDFILKVDDCETLGKYPAEVASKVRGRSGTKVKLEIARKGESNTLVFEITRESIDIDNLSYKKLDGGIYKIDIFQFIDVSADAFNSSWDKIVNEISAAGDAKGIIIDLRNNPGGYVISVKHILEEFFSNGAVLFKEREKNSAENVYKDFRVGKFENLPVTVIVNEGSASASEIFSSSIQDNNRGKIVGMKTVGKGVEQQALELSDGSMLIVVFQEWLTPNGRNITEENPITPDYELEYTEENYKNLRDPQLDKSIEIVKPQI